MTNPLVSAYLAVDGTLMKGANSAVRAYNWATGDTKVGLANKMLTVAPIADTVGIGMVISDSEYYMSRVLMVATVNIATSAYLQVVNNKVADGEERATNSHCLDAYSETIKNFSYPTGALGFVAVSTLSVSGALNADDSFVRTGWSISAAGDLLKSASCYVMRADSVPPRKDCVRRLADRVSEAVREYKERRAWEPALTSGRIL